MNAWTTIDTLTAALVVVTGVYVVLTYFILRATRRSVVAMEQQQESIARPYIVVGPLTFPNNPLLFLRIANTGRTAAQRVRLELDRPYFRFGRAADSENLQNFSVFSNPIGALAPGAELIFALVSSPLAFGEDADEARTPLVFTVTASYEYGGRSVQEATEVDLRPYRGMHMSYDPLIAELSAIKESLKKIQDRITRASS